MRVILIVVVLLVGQLRSANAGTRPVFETSPSSGHNAIWSDPSTWSPNLNHDAIGVDCHPGLPCGAWCPCECPADGSLLPGPNDEVLINGSAYGLFCTQFDVVVTAFEDVEVLDITIYERQRLEAQGITADVLTINGFLSANGLVTADLLVINGFLSANGVAAVDVRVHGTGEFRSSSTVDLLSVTGGVVIVDGSLEVSDTVAVEDGGALLGSGQLHTPQLSIMGPSTIALATDADLVTIGPSGTLTLSDDLVTFQNLQITGGTFRVNKDFTSVGTLNWANLPGPGSIVGSGTFTNGSNAKFSFVAFGSQFASSVSVPFTNKGLLTIARGSLSFSKTFVQTEGRIVLGTAPAATATAPTESVLETAGVDGSPMSLDVQGGLLLGVGTIRGNLLNSGGKVTPGYMPETETCIEVGSSGHAIYQSGDFNGDSRFGKIVIDGDFEQTSNGTLAIDVALGRTDVLEITGTAKLDGHLDVRVWQTDVLKGSSPIVVLRAQSTEGKFATVSEGFQSRVVYSGGEVLLVPDRFIPSGGHVRPPDQKQFDPNWNPCGLGEPRCCAETNAEDSGVTDPNCELTLPAPLDACNSPRKNQANIGEKGCTLTCGTMVANAIEYNGALVWKPASTVIAESINALGLIVFKNSRVIEEGACPANPDYSGGCATGTCRRKTNDFSFDKLAANVLSFGPAAWHNRRSSFASGRCPNISANSLAAWEDLIANYVWGNVPVHIRVGTNPTKAAHHSVIAYGVTLESGVRKILINDPGHSVNSIDSYPRIDSIDVLVPGAESWMAVHLDSPAELLATDGLGRRSGHDPRDGRDFFEIPGVSYSLQWPDDLGATDDQNAPEADRNGAHKALRIRGNSGEQIRVDVIRTGEGSLELELERFQASGNDDITSLPLLDPPPGGVSSFDLAIPGTGDGDGDGDIDTADASLFVSCFHGPDSTFNATGCESMDFDDDGDVDLGDYWVLQQSFTSCLSGCGGARCGNGIVEPRESEQCDPPNGKTCDPSCQVVILCGNGVLDPGEECDPPDGTTCDETCHNIQTGGCGEGIGDCFTPHPTPGCQDATCCGAVCALVPLCCSAAWDATCAGFAGFLCAPTQACCKAGVCTNLAQLQCLQSGGTPQGVGSTCATTVCTP